MARIAVVFGAAAAAVAGAMALSYLANGARQARQGQQAKPT
ncbi:hypothetical protein [Methylobacterium tarhaniae]|nr:hypothetical protein [Methylobacterium tarhaniae]